MINSLVHESEVIVSVPEDYGIDFSGPIPEEEVGTIEIPETLPPINDTSLREFLGFIDTDTFYEDRAVQYYIHCKHHLLNML